MTEGVPDRLFVVAPNKSPLAPGSHGLAHLAFWRREGAFAWIRARGFEEHWSVAEVPIYPAFPSGPWHAQVRIDAGQNIPSTALAPVDACPTCGGTGARECRNCAGKGLVLASGPPRTVSDDGYEPAARKPDAPDAHAEMMAVRRTAMEQAYLEGNECSACKGFGFVPPPRATGDDGYEPAAREEP